MLVGAIAWDKAQREFHPDIAHYAGLCVIVAGALFGELLLVLIGPVIKV